MTSFNASLQHWCKSLLASCLTTLVLVQVAQATVDDRLAKIQEHAVERRAVEGAIWGMPIVSFDAMRQAYLRDGGARYNDILYWSKPSDWRNQTTTPNHSTLYVMFFIQLKDGPVVVDVPPAKETALYGSLLTAWQVPQINVGNRGQDQGKGGRYLLLPPDYQGDVPPGYIPVQSNTYNNYSLLRLITPTQGTQDIAQAEDYLKGLKIYPLANAGAPSSNRYIDQAGKSFEGLPVFDDRFYDALARMLAEEPVQERDLAMMGQLRSLNIGKGLDFQPDAARRALLARAGTEAHDFMAQGFASTGGQVWADQRKWRQILEPKLVMSTKLSFVEPGQDLRLDERAFLFFAGYAPPVPSVPQVIYIKSYETDKGEALDGSHTYRLRIPAGVPASQFWAANAYDADTAGFIREAPVVGLDSYATDMKTNSDGSVDVYFAPKAPAGQEHNWVSTKAGGRFFVLFRFYGPQQGILDRSWVLGDLQRIQ